MESSLETGHYRFSRYYGQFNFSSLDIKIASYLVFLLLPSSLLSLFSSVARNVPFKVKSDQVSSQLKTRHWFSFQLKLQMFHPPTVSYMIFPLKSLSHVIPPISSSNAFLYSLTCSHMDLLLP